MTHAAAPGAVPRLSRRQFWGLFALFLLIFCVVSRPVWRHPWRMTELNVAILWSYIPIPILVAATLAYGKRLTFRGFFLDMLELTLIKYSVTFCFALVLWAVMPDAEGSPPWSRPAHVEATLAEPPPLPTPIAPEQTGTIRGLVTDAGGAPATGALVFIEAGLEGYVFAASQIPLDLVNDGTGIVPRLAAAGLRQPIRARSADGHLHTFIAVKDGATLLNVPLLGSGATTDVRFMEAHGVVTLRCSVHAHTGAEAASTLGVFAHPFFMITGADGRFEWTGVPSGSLRVAAWGDEGRGEVRREVGLGPRGTAEVALVLAAH